MRAFRRAARGIAAAQPRPSALVLSRVCAAAFRARSHSLRALARSRRGLRRTLPACADRPATGWVLRGWHGV